MIRYITFIALACLFISCNRSLNGRYVVSAIKEGDSGNDTISNFLKHKLVGDHFDLNIDSNTATLRSLNYHTQMILTRSKLYKQPRYLTSFNAKEAKFDVELKLDTGLTLEVTLSLPGDKPLMLPVQNSGFNITDLTKGNPKLATVDCYLSKISN
jgi:hypothetical protein